jgi:glycogen synthase
MNLLYISNEYPPETGLGGIGTYTRHIARGMSARGHSVHVVCRSPDDSKHETTDGAVIVHRVPPARFGLPQAPVMFPVRSIIRKLFFQSLVKSAWSLAAADTARGLINQGQKFDIVESAECNGESYHLKNIRDIRRVVKLHTPWSMVRALDRIPEGVCDRTVSDRMERVAACTAHAVSSPSRELAQLMQTRWRLSPVAFLPNPIPVSDYPESDGSGLIYTGRVERRKGIHVLVLAYAELCRDTTPPILRIVGRPYGELPDGSAYGDYIERLINQHDLTNRIEWIRGVPSTEVKRYLRKSSIAVFPSLWENFPYSCLEAMASGLAVISSKTGGYLDMIEDGVSGLLVAPENHLLLAQKIRELIGQSHLVKKLGAAARRQVTDRFDTAPVSRLTEDFYRQVDSHGPS